MKLSHIINQLFLCIYSCNVRLKILSSSFILLSSFSNRSVLSKSQSKFNIRFCHTPYYNLQLVALLPVVGMQVVSQTGSSKLRRLNRHALVLTSSSDVSFLQRQALVLCIHDGIRVMLPLHNSIVMKFLKTKQTVQTFSTQTRDDKTVMQWRPRNLVLPDCSHLQVWRSHVHLLLLLPLSLISVG